MSGTPGRLLSRRDRPGEVHRRPGRRRPCEGAVILLAQAFADLARRGNHSPRDD